jgi:hypothetical protein
MNSNILDTTELDVTGQTKWVSDEKGGHVLRAWTEGRLWPVETVMRSLPVLLHAAGCTKCSWSHYTVELCIPGLRIIDELVAPA